MKVVVTGTGGFIGKNLMVHLRQNKEDELIGLTRDCSALDWQSALKDADRIYHLAGVNRPESEEDFLKDNAGLTAFIVDELEKGRKPYQLLYSSSAQAELDNPYGKSKKKGEEYIKSNVRNGAAFVYRLPGVFGKWCRPNYNSVVATFCHNLATGLPIRISDPSHQLKLVYIDDVVREFITRMDQPFEAGRFTEAHIDSIYQTNLGELARIIGSFPENRKTLFVPDLGNGLEKALYSTWLSYLPADRFSYDLELKTDTRGSLFELLKTRNAGQIFISTTRPGITRGNHFHHSKTEKFVVIQGEGLIQLRSVLGKEIIEYKVNGALPKVVDIPPGFTHNITNTGEDLMVTLFWANEVFDPQRPDTIFEKV
jgi:UDP-2-acetamido-2,6-beta-L-arabino-hexul-4-ose reductase